MGRLQKIYKTIEKLLPLITILSFLLGIWIANKSEGFAKVIDRGMSGMIDAYQYIAPIAIFVILTPSLAKIFSATKSNRIIAVLEQNLKESYQKKL